MLAFFIAVAVAQTPESRVELIRTPSNGIQPRAAVDEQGTLHVVYFRGDAEAGELEYVRSTDGGKKFDEPLRVNAEPKSAVALGNVRGAQIALGRGGRVHVAWNGTVRGDTKDSPMLYTRLDETGTRFEPERDVAREHHGLDGGGAVAADATGNVWVVWHAPDGGKGEADRRVYVTRSKDDGTTFEREVAASKKGPGVCPCCGLGAFACGGGGLAILYRTARDGDRRDTMLLHAPDLGSPFRAKLVDKWRVPT
jgi:hypothetical protein